eukprot:2058273-Pleurochrysis_carterae.AAC.1
MALRSSPCIVFSSLVLQLRCATDRLVAAVLIRGDSAVPVPQRRRHATVSNALQHSHSRQGRAVSPV